jgi:hypothetical protein
MMQNKNVQPHTVRHQETRKEMTRNQKEEICGRIEGKFVFIDLYI